MIGAGSLDGTGQGGTHAQGVRGAGATSTKQELNGAAPAGDVRSRTSTLAQPCVSSPAASGVNQAPSLMETTPVRRSCGRRCW